MKVRMRVTMTGSRNGLDWPPVGGEIDLPADEAAHMVGAGLASRVEVAPVLESAALSTAPKARRAKA